jgi:hypothetical protein
MPRELSPLPATLTTRIHVCSCVSWSNEHVPITFELGLRCRVPKREFQFLRWRKIPFYNRFILNRLMRT